MVKTSQQPLKPGNFLLLFIGIAFATASQTMTMVQIPIFLRELGADISQIGLFFTLSLIFPLLLRIFGGWISDRIGRLRAIWIGSIAGALAYIPYMLAPTWYVALFGPALLAIATALIAPSYRAYIADTTDKEVLGRVFGITETVRNLAWFIGPPIGGLLAQYLGYRWLFAASILSYSIAALVFYFLTHILRRAQTVEVYDTTQPSFRQSLRDISILMVSGGLISWLLITDGIYDIASKLSVDLMPVYLSDIAGLSKPSIGLLDGLHGIALVVAGPIGGWIVDKASERVGVTLGLIIMIVSNLIFAFATGFWGFAVSWIILGVSGAMLLPALNSLVAKGVPSRLLGITYALIATSLGLISLPFPWIGSQLWNAIGPISPYLVTAILGGLAIIPAWFKLVIPETREQDTRPGPGSNQPKV
jgi:DHA1 family multidrug resistance protein-like MFS transporter